jgi:hypothetical protein
MSKRTQASVPRNGGTTPTGTYFALTLTFKENVPLPDFEIFTLETGPFVPERSL